MPVALRRRLFLLSAAALLPLAIMAAISLWGLRTQQTSQTTQVSIELTRSVATAVEAEIRNSISALTTLSTAVALDTADLTAFRERANRVVSVRPEWAALQLIEPDGRVAFDSRVPAGSVTPDVHDIQSFRRIVSSGVPVVGDLTRHDPNWFFAVRVPVVRDGKLKYVLTALVSPSTIRDVLTRQRTPEDWVISVVDSKGVRVARSRAHEQNLGGRLSETAEAILKDGGREGVGYSYALEGDRILTPYSRLDSIGWTIVVGIPTHDLDLAVNRSLLMYGLGVILSIGLGTLGALWIARTITRPIAQLRSAAEALGRKAVPRTPDTNIEEIHEVGKALANAGEDLAEAEVERETLLRKEREAREAAEAADRAKDEFMAVVSHELRTPLNAVYGWARMLQSGLLRDEATVTRAKDAIVRNADAQVQLIDDLLDWSRIVTGKMRLDVRRVDLRNVLRDAIETVRPAADARSISLQLDISTDIRSVTGDPTRLQQVVWNLLMNAVKFTDRGGTVRLEARPSASSVEIIVSDTGRGIPREVLPHIFERFRQADSSSTRAHGGLGLGLSLVKHLVELHGGAVSAHSEGLGKGASFTVVLPVGIVAIPFESGAAAPPPDAIQIPADITRLDGLKILVVDDDKEGLSLAEAILARAGAEVQICTSAASAFETFREWRPDVLVSDLEMPGEDGYSLIRNVRRLPAADGGETPAIALSGYGRPVDRLKALESGFSMHVPKPVDPRELTAIIAGIAAPKPT